MIVLIGLVVLLMCFALVLYAHKTMKEVEVEAFEADNKFPVSEFTLSYIRDKASDPNLANNIYRKIEVVEKGSTVKVPTPKPGTIIDVPRTYTSSWVNL